MRVIPLTERKAIRKDHESDVAEVEADRVMGATGNPATMSDMVFSSVPGAPAYIEKSSRYKVRCPEVGIELDVSGRSAILTTFSYQG